MVYEGEGDIELEVLTHRDLSEAEDFGILWEKPDGTEGQFDLAGGCILHESNKAILYDVADDTFLDAPGLWKFQAFAIFDGNTSLGDVAKITVHKSLL